jgi:hypothetical protein
MLVGAGHVTCIDVEITPDHQVSCCVLDSVSDINTVTMLPVLQRIHAELNGTVVHFISTVGSRHENQASQMQSDRSNCKLFALHCAIQAGKVADLHTIAHNAIDRTEDYPWIEQFKKRIGDFAWLQCKSWSHLSPKFVKHSQSRRFFEGHHPEAKYPALVDDGIFNRMGIKIYKRTQQAVSTKEVNPYLQGPIARQKTFIEQANVTARKKKRP